MQRTSGNSVRIFSSHYRSGRQSDALDVYRRTRELLADELGLEPSRGLQQLERSILQHDPDRTLRMQAETQIVPASKTAIWAGRALTGFAVLFLA